MEWQVVARMLGVDPPTRNVQVWENVWVDDGMSAAILLAGLRLPGMMDIPILSR